MHHIGERAYKLLFSPFVIFPFSSFTRMFRPMQCTVLFRALPNLPFLPLYICFYVTSCSNLMVSVIRRIELLSELINILQHNILSGSLALQGLLQIHIPSCFLVNRFNLNNRNAGSVAAEIQEPQVLKFWSRIFFLSNFGFPKISWFLLMLQQGFPGMLRHVWLKYKFSKGRGSYELLLHGFRWVEMGWVKISKNLMQLLSELLARRRNSSLALCRIVNHCVAVRVGV